MEHRGEQFYHLKLDMLLIVLRANQQTCLTCATISPAVLQSALGSGRLSRKKGFSASVVELNVINGEAATAIIRDADGQTLAMGEVALAICKRCGVLSWNMRTMPLQDHDVELQKKFATNSQTDLVIDPPVPSAWSQRPPPRWTYPLTQEDIDSLPRKHRQVLLLIDGKRGFGELCRILHCPSDQLIAIFDDLILRNFIYVPHDGK